MNIFSDRFFDRVWKKSTHKSEMKSKSRWEGWTVFWKTRIGFLAANCLLLTSPSSHQLGRSKFVKKTHFQVPISYSQLPVLECQLRRIPEGKGLVQSMQNSARLWRERRRCVCHRRKSCRRARGTSLAKTLKFYEFSWIATIKFNSNTSEHFSRVSRRYLIKSKHS